MILFDPKDPKWLHGKRCETHPYLSGLRFAATGNCVHCEDPLEIIPCDMTPHVTCQPWRVQPKDPVSW